MEESGGTPAPAEARRVDLSYSIEDVIRDTANAVYEVNSVDQEEVTSDPRNFMDEEQFQIYLNYAEEVARKDFNQNHLDLFFSSAAD